MMSLKSVVACVAFVCFVQTNACAEPGSVRQDDPAAGLQGWRDRTVLVLGDSITDPGLRYRWKNYWAYLPELLGVHPAVYGLSGEQWDGILRLARRAKSEMGEAPDAILVFAGTNDFISDVPLGEWHEVREEKTNRWGKTVTLPRRNVCRDMKTFRGRINVVLDYLKTEFPDAQVVLLTPPHRAFFTCGGDNIQPDESFPNGLGLYLDDYIRAIREGGAAWSVPVIDLYGESGLCPRLENQGRLYADPKNDRLHPSSEGHRRLALLIASKLNALPPTFKRSDDRKPVRLVAFGDSITQAIIGVGPTETWLGHLQRRFGRKVLIFNAGIGGNSAREAMARYESDVLARKPDVVLLEFGGNNNDFRNPARRVDDAEFREHLKRFRDGLPKACRVIAITFPPIKDEWHRVYQGSPDNYVGDAALDSQRQIVRDFARENGWPVVDLHAIMKDRREEMLHKDGVHLNARGQETFAEAVAAVLEKQCVLADGGAKEQAKADAGREIDVWSRRERHPAVVNAVTAERDGFTLSLRGEWDFKPIERIGTRFPAHTNAFFWAEGVSKIKVPGCWEAQGVGTAATSTPWAVFWDSSPAPYRHVFRGWAWYRKAFEVPAEWKGRRIWLKIGGVASEGTFTVNGRSVARINPYCGTWKYEITDLVRLGGTNVVAAVVSNRTPSRRGSSASSNHWGGLWRDVEIEATPSECFIDDAWVRGDFDRQEAEVHVEVEGLRGLRGLKGLRGAEEENSIRVTIEGSTTEVPLTSQTSQTSQTPQTLQTSQTCVKIALRDFRAWSPEHPNLYTARVELVSNGRVVQTRRERFGVRKLETRGNEFYLNGRPFFVRGAGYHHIYSLTGIPPADDQDELRRRVRKIRATGFNYVRLHTRCEIPEFFEVCDEEGLMVEPELPYYHSLQCDGLAFDPFADAKELYENFRRYPSFVAYSGGNEGDFDEACARDLYREIRTRDPDRLMIAQDGSKDFRKKEFTDFQSGPFTAWPRGAFRSELPFVAHEYMNQCVKFDSRASEKFTGVRPPPISRQERADWLARFGLDLVRGDRLQEGQNAIQRYWHKYGIEAARADPYCSGYSFWSLQDACSPQLGTYSGQAIYDPFFDDKRGGSTAESFRVFNGPVALLFDTETGVRDFGGVDPRRVGKVDRMLDCDMDDFDLYVEGTNRVYVSGEPIAAKFLLSHYGERDFAAARLSWKLTADGETLASGTKDLGLQRVGRVRKVFDEPIAAPDVAKGVRAEMSVTLTDGGREVAANSWPLYVLPKRGVVSHPDVAVAPALARRFAGRFAFASDLAAAKTVIAPHGSPEAKAALAAGKNLVTLANQEGPSNIRLGWWWMGSQMGMAFEPSPVFAELPQETSLTPLYMRLVKEGTPLPLADFQTEDLVVYGEGGEKCYAYLAIRTLPQGGRHAFVSGLDLLSDLPEGTALLEGILKEVSGNGRLVVDLPASPVCKIGFLTDTHLRPGADEINDRTRKAFEVFKAQGVDAIGHCGDLADLHYPEMYDLYRSFIEKTYPDETKRPQLLYVYANHDLIDVAKLKAGVKGSSRQMPFEEGFREMKDRLGIGHWLFHSTEVKGVPVVVLPQIFEYEGGIARVERMLEEACAAHPTGPIVVLSHLAPAGTVYGSERWGYWNYRQVLEKFPRVISFSGHTHNSLRNPASFWQGAFSAVDVGCLEWWYGREEDGCDGGFACRVKSAYGVPIAEFYPDRVVIRRYDVRDGSEMDADAPWTVRQPYAGRPSGTRGGRVPRFADGAKLSVAERGDKVVLTFPPAEREDDVLSYRIEASVREGDGWHTLVKGGCYSQFYLRPSERKDVCVREIARNAFQNELTYRFTVTPVGVDGTEGPALQADLTMR